MDRTSISEIKMKAKDNLLGYYGISAGAFALLFALVYGLLLVLWGAMNAGMPAGEMAGGDFSLTTQIESYAVSFVVGVFSSILTTGYVKMMLEISYGRSPKMSMLFFCFKNHPDKVIILYALLSVIQIILLMPSKFVKWSWEGLLAGEGDGRNFLLWIILILVGFGISLYINIVFGFCFLVYIGDPDMSIRDILICSQRLMKGNKCRYVYLFLSFVGYYILGIISLGITLMYTVPYQNMATVELYKDALDYVDKSRFTKSSVDLES